MSITNGQNYEWAIGTGEGWKSFQKRKGTASNAHSLFVLLPLKLLEERVIVECKDIITLEKQFKLLEEEEKEWRIEEERKKRRRAKEKEQKLHNVTVEVGFIAVVGHTHVLQEGPMTGKAIDVIAAANTAAEVALRFVRPGKRYCSTADQFTFPPPRTTSETSPKLNTQRRYSITKNPSTGISSYKHLQALSACSPAKTYRTIWSTIIADHGAAAHDFR
ncbi:hypothetical protein L1887_19110 [Cichorium endivia]|nr:hypothetical protein L1887_19110 [Cichorium endivia]